MHVRVESVLEAFSVPIFLYAARPPNAMLLNLQMQPTHLQDVGMICTLQKYKVQIIWVQFRQINSVGGCAHDP